MENEHEEILKKMQTIDKSLNTTVTLTLEDGPQLVFTAINTTVYMRARALLQTPDQNIFAEPETLGWINEFSEGATLLDIGANVGTFSIYAAAVKKARVYSFEPSSPNFFCSTGTSNSMIFIIWYIHSRLLLVTKIKLIFFTCLT